METFGKIVASFFFIIFFILFLVVGTIKFKILNPNFIFSTFDRNGVYSKLPGELARALPNDPNLTKDEREGYTPIVSSITPDLLKNTFETNLPEVLNFINGTSRDINISVPASKFGLGEDFTWSLQNLPKESLSKIEIAYGFGNKLLYIWLGLLILLVLLFLAAGRSVLLVSGIFTLLLGGIGSLLLFVISSNTPVKPEPSQVFLAILSTSLLADIAYTWLGVGVVLMVLWTVLRKIQLVMS